MKTVEVGESVPNNIVSLSNPYLPSAETIKAASAAVSAMMAIAVAGVVYFFQKRFRKETYRQMLFRRKLLAYERITRALFQYSIYWAGHSSVNDDPPLHEALHSEARLTAFGNVLYLSPDAFGLVFRFLSLPAGLPDGEHGVFDEFVSLVEAFREELGIYPLTDEMIEVFQDTYKQKRARNKGED